MISAYTIAKGPASRLERRGGRVAILDPLRGIAAFSVAWFHLTRGNPALIPREHPLSVTGQFGYLGVEMFFVISGFVIPLALKRSGYETRDYPRFLIKRVLRIDPPYFCTIGLCLALAWLGAKTPGFAGEPFRVSFPQLVSHVGYWTQLAGYQWFNIVFWTLSIEAQFYLVMGVIFRTIDKSKRASIMALVIALLLSQLVTNGGLVFTYAPLFATGFIAYCVHTSSLRARDGLVLISVVFAFQATLASALIASVGAGTAALIVASAQGWPRIFASTKRSLPAVMMRSLSKLGTISYSLYLVHVPIGGRVINLGARFAHTEATREAVLLVATVVSIAAALVFYRLVELPSQRWASSIDLHGANSPEQVQVVAVS